GACVYCTSNDQCPNGLNCGPDGLCHGAHKGDPCPTGVACDEGLMCILFGGVPACATACNMYAPTSCASTELCLKLTFTGSNSLVFENGAPLGVCHAPFGEKKYRETCSTCRLYQSACDKNEQCCS